MSQLTSAEEIEIIEGAINVILAQKQALAAAVQQLTPLADENLNLRDIIQGLESEDAASDAALTRLRDILPQAPAPVIEPEAPVVTPEPETPVIPEAPTDPETPAGVDPVDPPAGEETPAQ